jgi:translin
LTGRERVTRSAQAARAAADRLRPFDADRQNALSTSHEVVRAASAAIRALHRAERPRDTWTELERAVQRLRDFDSHPLLAWHGAVVQAWGEYVEAHLLAAAMDGKPLPDAKALAANPGGYLLGMADTVGELRRLILSRLAKDDVAGGEDALDLMENLFDALVDADAPEGVVSLRHKVDAARSLLERTRGEVVTAKRTKELEKKIEGVGRLLDEAEAGRAKKRVPKKSDDLDLDAAWNKD